MRSLQISYTNTKGQFVIPKEQRDELGINPDTALLSKVAGKSIILTPVINIITEPNYRREAFLKVLENTMGAWGPETKEEKRLRERDRKEDLKSLKEKRKEW